MNRIRFSAYNQYNELVGQSDWFPERTSADAPAALSHYRETMGGDCSYQIERTGDSRVPNRPKLYRFRIKEESDGTPFYSRLIQENEKESALKKVAEMFPEAEITEEAV